MGAHPHRSRCSERCSRHRRCSPRGCKREEGGAGDGELRGRQVKRRLLGQLRRAARHAVAPREKGRPADLPDCRPAAPPRHAVLCAAAHRGAHARPPPPPPHHLAQVPSLVTNTASENSQSLHLMHLVGLSPSQLAHHSGCSPCGSQGRRTVRVGGSSLLPACRFPHWVRCSAACSFARSCGLHAARCTETALWRAAGTERAHATMRHMAAPTWGWHWTHVYCLVRP